MLQGSAAPNTRAAYGNVLRRRFVVLGALAVALAVSFFADLATGASNLPIADLLHVLAAPDAADRSLAVIVWQIRLPQAVMAVLVGAALSAAGAEMQTILNNPLASPFTLGVSSAAAFGAALAIVLSIGLPGVSANWLVAGNAFLFALLATILLQALARLGGHRPEALVLFGIALLFTFNALVSLVQFVASQEALQQLVFWTMGSLARATWAGVLVLAIVVAAVMPFSFLAAWTMTALRLGEDRARSFGVNTGRLRFLALLRVSFLTATSVAFVGTIGFVGLVGPHIARLLIGEDHRFLLPASLLSGALVMSLASTASKLVVPGALVPIGIVTALIGVPFFVVLIAARRERF